MPVVLLIREEDEVHSVVLSQKPIVMGRSSSCDIRLTDEKISSKHLALKVNSSGKVIIKDLGSTNGTYLNGSQIEDALLMLEDQLVIGGVSLWIDPEQLTPKEKQPLTRLEAPAKLKFINLKQTNTRVDVPSKPTKVPPKPQKDSFTASLARKLPDPDAMFVGKDQAMFDLEEPSGETHFYKVPKASPTTEKMKKKSSPKVRKKVDTTENIGLFQRLLSLFKKKS
jgi:pSer/pThr/pTyr-binding forkhead associated (FHA) protein